MAFDVAGVSPCNRCQVPIRCLFSSFFADRTCSLALSCNVRVVCPMYVDPHSLHVALYTINRS